MSYVNLSAADRIVRCVVGVAMLVIGWSGLVEGIWGAALQLFGWFPLVAGITGWSALYALFGWSTRKQGRDERL